MCAACRSAMWDDVETLYSNTPTLNVWTRFNAHKVQTAIVECWVRGDEGHATFCTIYRRRKGERVHIRFLLPKRFRWCNTSDWAKASTSNRRHTGTQADCGQNDTRHGQRYIIFWHRPYIRSPTTLYRLYRQWHALSRVLHRVIKTSWIGHRRRRRRIEVVVPTVGYFFIIRFRFL